MAAYYCLNKDRVAMTKTLFIFLFGFVLFAVTWKFYYAGTIMDVWEPLRYAAFAATTRWLNKTMDSRVLGLSLTVIRFALWFGTYFILCWLFACVKSYHAFKTQKAGSAVFYLALFSFCVGIGHFLSGGLPFGFPRFHFIMLGAMSLLCAFILVEPMSKLPLKSMILLFVGLIFAVLFYRYFVKDLILTLNFELRQALALFPGQARSVLRDFTARYTLYLIPSFAIVVVLWFKRKLVVERIMIAFFVLILSSNLAMAFTQRSADYLTGFCYGTRGMADVIRYVDSNIILGDKVLAPNDILYYLQAKKVPYLKEDFWEDLDRLLQAIRQSKAKFVVYSIGHNNIEQFKNVFLKKEFTQMLAKYYRLIQIGSFNVWERLNHDKS